MSRLRVQRTATMTLHGVAASGRSVRTPRKPTPDSAARTSSSVRDVKISDGMPSRSIGIVAAMPEHHVAYLEMLA